MAPGCPPHSPKVNTGRKRGSRPTRGPRPRTTVGTAAQGRWGGRPCRSPPLTKGVPAAGWRWAPVSHRVQAGGGLGPVGLCGPAGRKAEWAGAVGVPGTWPSRPSLQLLKASSTTALFTGGHGPSGRLHYRLVHGLKGPSSQPLWAASPAPGRRGARTGYLLPFSLPSHHGEGEPPPPPCPWGNSQAQPLLRDFHGSQADVRRAAVS